MDKKKLEALLEIIHEVVQEPGKTWREKRDAILDAVPSEDHEGDLEEFGSWFSETPYGN